MSGYEKSPDYGGGDGGWKFGLVVAAVCVVIGAAVVWAAFVR